MSPETGLLTQFQRILPAIFRPSITLYIYMYMYIYYIYVYLKSIGATFFFREDSVIYLVGLAAQKLDAKEAGYEGNLGDFVIGLV